MKIGGLLVVLALLCVIGSMAIHQHIVIREKIASLVMRDAEVTKLLDENQRLKKRLTEVEPCTEFLKSFGLSISGSNLCVGSGVCEPESHNLGAAGSATGGPSGEEHQ